MPRLFLLAVGGTGIRVTKALINVLATGVQPQGQWTIVPVALDPHRRNKDLLRTNAQLRRYARLHEAVFEAKLDGEPWFGTPLVTLDAIGEQGRAARDGELLAELTSLGDKKFSEYIGTSEMHGARRALVHALYSQDQLDTHMDIGFVGNPGIGVVALDGLNEHSALRDLASAFAEGDRIFIINSIFGGTGAAAFPRLLNLFRQADREGLPNANALKAATIGALSVQPYFRVGDGTGDDDRIKQDEFMQRTRAALRYYARAVKGEVDAFYTLGRNSAKSIDNDPGEGGQQNPAHFAELAGALAVLHFLDNKPGRSATSPSRTEEFAYGITAEPAGAVTFDVFDDRDRRRLLRPFSRFYLLCRYLAEAGEDEMRRHRQVEYLDSVSAGFADSRERSVLVDFVDDWRGWVDEMTQGDPELRLFTWRTDLAEGVNGLQPVARGGLGSIFGSKTKKLALTDVRDALNAAAKSLTRDLEDLPYLLAVYQAALRKVADETYAFPDD